MISLIWAMDENRLIGNKNLIPWHIKEDLLYYKSQTAGKTVLMGDVTYFSLKSYYKTRPLPYGKIYVATLDNKQDFDANVILVNDLPNFFENTKEDIFVCGGSTIYKIALEYANRLYISIIKGKYEGDRYFPEFNLDEYQLVSQNETNLVKYLIYDKKVI